MLGQMVHCQVSVQTLLPGSSHQPLSAIFPSPITRTREVTRARDQSVTGRRSLKAQAYMGPQGLVGRHEPRAQ